MKLSESGRLYLVDYHLLEEARGEMTVFLDAVVEELERQLRRDLGKQNSGPVVPELWSNRTSRGFVEVSLKLARTTGSLDGGGLAVWYRDIRHDSTIDNPLTAAVTVRSKSAFAATQRATPDELMARFVASLAVPDAGIATEPSGRVHWQNQVPFDKDSSQASAQLIGDIMIDKCAKIAEFLSQVAEHLEARSI